MNFREEDFQSHRVYFFHFHFQNKSDMETKIQKRKQHLLDKRLKFQPIIIVLCSKDLRECKSFYVYFDRIYQEFSTFIEALDFMFKLTHVLNLEYSEDCRQVWMFIQKYFYEINTLWDSKIKTPTTDNFIINIKS